MMRVMVNQRAEMERVEARILLEDLLEAWKHTRMFPADQVSLRIEKKLIFIFCQTLVVLIFRTLKVINFDGMS
jgi:hypothetical protein